MAAQSPSAKTAAFEPNTLYDGVGVGVGAGNETGADAEADETCCDCIGGGDSISARKRK